MGVLIENRSPTRDEVTLVHEIADTTLQVGSVIDTARYVEGVTFVPIAFGLQPTANYVFVIEESDSDSMIPKSVVEDGRLTAPISEISRLNKNDSNGSFLNAVGVVNVKRFITITGQCVNEATSGAVVVEVREGIDTRAVVNN